MPDCSVPARVASVARPLDVQALAGGSLLVSDDSVGTVYRITYDPAAPASSQTVTSNPAGSVR